MSVTAVKLWAFCGHDDRPIVGGALILTLSSGLLRKGSTTKARSSATTVMPQAMSARTVVGGNVTVVGGSTTSDVGFMLDGDNVTVDGGGARIVTVTGQHGQVHTTQARARIATVNTAVAAAQRIRVGHMLGVCSSGCSKDQASAWNC
jgi:hypothetical protein